MRRVGSAANSRRASVVLPAPAGDERINSMPRRPMPGPLDTASSRPSSLNVLDLLTHLIDDGLQLQAGPCRLRIAGFGAQRVRLAIELLRQKIEPSPGRLLGAQE